MKDGYRGRGTSELQSPRGTSAHQTTFLSNEHEGDGETDSLDGFMKVENGASQKILQKRRAIKRLNASFTDRHNHDVTGRPGLIKPFVK